MSDDMMIDFKGAAEWTPAPSGPRTDAVPNGTYRGTLTALEAGSTKEGQPKLVATFTHEGNDDEAVDGFAAVRHVPVTGTMKAKRGGKEVTLPRIQMLFDLMYAGGMTAEEIKGFEGKKFKLSAIQKRLVGKPFFYRMGQQKAGQYAGNSELQGWETEERWEGLKAAGKLRSTATSARSMSAEEPEDDDEIPEAPPAAPPAKAAPAAKPAPAAKATPKPKAAAKPAPVEASDDLDALMGESTADEM